MIYVKTGVQCTIANAEIITSNCLPLRNQQQSWNNTTVLRLVQNNYNLEQKKNITMSDTKQQQYRTKATLLIVIENNKPIWKQ
jgi:hypothetical protein